MLEGGLKVFGAFLKGPGFLGDFIVLVYNYIDLIVAFLEFIEVLFFIALLRFDLLLEQLDDAFMLLDDLFELSVLLLCRTHEFLVLFLAELVSHLEAAQLHAQLSVTLHQLLVLPYFCLQLVLALPKLLPRAAHLQLQGLQDGLVLLLYSGHFLLQVIALLLLHLEALLESLLLLLQLCVVLVEGLEVLLEFVEAGLGEVELPLSLYEFGREGLGAFLEVLDVAFVEVYLFLVFLGDFFESGVLGGDYLLVVLLDYGLLLGHYSQLLEDLVVLVPERA